MRLLVLAILPVFAVSGADLQADLKAGEKLLESLPVFAEGHLKTACFEVVRSGKTAGYGVVSLSAVKDQGTLTLRYTTEGALKTEDFLEASQGTMTLDCRFHLKTATRHSIVHLASKAEPRESEEQVVVEGDRIKVKTSESGESKEFPLDDPQAVTMAAEVLQWVKFGELKSFALRELDPRGRMVFPEGPIHTSQRPKPSGKSYGVQTWRFEVLRNTDGGVCLRGIVPGGKDFPRRMDFDRNGALSCLSAFVHDRDKPGSDPMVVSEMKVVTEQRVRELKALFQP